MIFLHVFDIDVCGAQERGNVSGACRMVGDTPGSVIIKEICTINSGRINRINYTINSPPKINSI